MGKEFKYNYAVKCTLTAASALQEAICVQFLKCALYTIILFNLFNLFAYQKWGNIKNIVNKSSAPKFTRNLAADASGKCHETL